MNDQTISNGQLATIAGTPIFLCHEQGADLSVDRHLTDLIGDLYGVDVSIIAIPLPRLGSQFLQLSNGVAGHVLQKLVNYRFQVVILGDVSEAATASTAVRDFVRETNRGKNVWFVANLNALAVKLAEQPH